MLKRSIFKLAFDHTYGDGTAKGRSFDDLAPVNSFVSGFLGLQYKYKDKLAHRSPYQIFRLFNVNNPPVTARRFWDRNLFNWLEQIFFAPFRVLKNIVKLLTEYVWATAHFALNELSESFNNSNHLGDAILSNLFFVLSYLVAIVGAIGRQITSPFASMKMCYNLFVDEKRHPLPLLVGFTFAAFSGIASLAWYGLISALAFPLLVPLLGSQIPSAISSAASWFASTTVGAAATNYIVTFAASLGLNLSQAVLASSAAAVGAFFAASSAIAAALKVVLRFLSPYKNKPESDRSALNRLPAPQMRIPGLGALGYNYAPTPHFAARKSSTPDAGRYGGMPIIEREPISAPILKPFEEQEEEQEEEPESNQVFTLS